MNTRRTTYLGQDGHEYAVLEPIDFARFGDNADLYRFSLVRTLDWLSADNALFIMLNPSTADETYDDPTIRRCKDFALRAGCGVLSVVNLSPRRATDPDDLIMAGPEDTRSMAGKLEEYPELGVSSNQNSARVWSERVHREPRYQGDNRAGQPRLRQQFLVSRDHQERLPTSSFVRAQNTTDGPLQLEGSIWRRSYVISRNTKAAK